MTVLNPDPSTLGLESPGLGPWFSTDVTLPAPDADLGVSFTIPSGTHWLPPATGLLSLSVVSGSAPMLQGLRGPGNASPFTADRLVAVFRLLAETEARLAALSAGLPAVDGSATGRARVRTFAMQLPASVDLARVADMVDPPVDSSLSNAQKAMHLGLELDGTLTNATTPMTDLKRPGEFLGSAQALLKFSSDTTVTLYAFDHRGRPLDAGAVASWWDLLRTDFTNLMAPGVSDRTASAAAHLSVHLTGPNEGPVRDEVLGRLTGLSGTSAVREVSTSGATLTLTAGAADDAPIPKVAVLPQGTYADSVTLWSGGPVGGMTRDFVRLALLDVEHHLTGQPRVAGSGASSAATRRAEDQARASTRTLVARATSAAGQSVLLPTADEALAALSAVVAAGPAAVVAPLLDRAAGPLSPPSLPAAAPPNSTPAVTAVALTGGGTAAGGTVTNQRVLVTVTLDSSLDGAWVRVWPQYFDATTGRHLRAKGGGGRCSGGQARCVLRLPDGAVSPDNPLGLDVMVVTALAATRYPEARLDRPTPVGGTPVALPAQAGPILACETGQVFANAAAVTGLVSGCTLVALSGTPALVDPASIPTSAMASTCLGPTLTAADVVQLTPPAWAGWQGGETSTILAGGGATVTAIERDGLSRLTRPGAPLPAQSRDEVAACVLTSAVADAVVAGVWPLAAHHELLPHQGGHPGAPADDERHGTGVRLRGPAVVALAEILRDRMTGSTPELISAASTPMAVPADPTVAGSWAAVLRTVGFGVEAEPGLIAALNAVGVGAFPFDGPLTAIRDWLDTAGIPVPASISGPVDSVERALNRRMLGAARGYREAATALAAAVSQAQDFVYIETTAFDHLGLGSGDDGLSLWSVLADRLTENPVLRVLVCVPLDLAPGAPSKLQKVRDAGVLDALATLSTDQRARLCLFTPVTGPGRALYIDATTVVVDDAWAMTGGTHLWRRGLGYDGSLAVSVFDERLAEGRPAEVLAFRRSLVAGRLGLSVDMLPEDPDDLLDAVARLAQQGGGLRLSPTALMPPDPAPSTTDITVWNPDGSPVTGFDPLSWVASLSVYVAAEVAPELPS